MDNMEKLVKKHNNKEPEEERHKIVIFARIILVPQMVNVYHQTLFIRLKSLLATINTETNTLVSAKQNSKPGQVAIKIHLKTDEKKDTGLSKYTWNLKDKKIVIK